MRSLRSLHLRLVRSHQINFIQNQAVARVGHLDVLATSENLVSTMLLIPLRDGRVLVHVLDDVSPTDSRIVGAEGNLAFLRAVRDDAHFGATEIVVEEILEPHSRDKQEVPAIRTALLDIIFAAIAADLAVVLTSQAKRLVKLLEEFVKREL